MTGPTGRLFVVADSSSLGLRRTRQTGRVLRYLNVVPRPVAPPRGPAPWPSPVARPTPRSPLLARFHWGRSWVSCERTPPGDRLVIGAAQVVEVDGAPSIAPPFAPSTLSSTPGGGEIGQFGLGSDPGDGRTPPKLEYGQVSGHEHRHEHRSLRAAKGIWESDRTDVV